jgi:enoyl-CoA hydratase/carnithine racemase
MAVNTEKKTDAVLVERRGAALWLTLNRPEALNGLSPEIVAGLEAGLDLAESDDSVRAVVFAGAGRAFCAGADLKHVGSLSGSPGSSAQQRFLHLVGATFDRIESFPKPTIAAVHGIAVAGGIELVLCCDLVWAGEAARFGDAHGNYGLLPGGGASIRLPRRIGVTRAKFLLYSGAILPCRKLETWGLINEIVPDDRLVSEVDDVVELLAARSPLAIRRVKRLVNDGLAVPQPVGLRMELDASAAYESSHDYQEGLAAFAEKRTPEFTGQ